MAAALIASVVTAVPAHAIAPTVPGAPTNVVAGQVASGVVEVDWDAPVSDGGSPLTSYTVSEGGGATCTTTDTAPGGEYCFVTGLALGSYVFRVVANNAVGSSVASSAAPSITVVATGVLWTAPQAPVNVVVYDSPYDHIDSSDVSWQDGGNAGPPVLGYAAVATPGGQYCTSTTTACTIPGLTGAPYSVTVVAVNDFGTSAPSAAFTPPRYRVPDAPWGVTVDSVGYTTATVRWSGVTSFFGNENDYIITASPGGISCVSPATSPAWLQPNACVVQGLTPQTTYTFTVSAKNVNGTGAPSAASAPVTTAAAPSVIPPVAAPPRAPFTPLPRPPLLDKIAPAAVAGVVSVGVLSRTGLGAQLSWSLPGGADVASIRIGITRGVGSVSPATLVPGVTADIDRTGATFAGLQPGFTYTVAVYAVDAAGNVAPGVRASLAGSAAKAVAPTTTRAGLAIPVKFSLLDLGRKGLANKPVQVLVRPAGNGPWRLYRRSTTNSRGEVTVLARPTTNTQFALRYAGETGRLGFVAAAVATVKVSSSVTATVRVGARVGVFSMRRGAVARVTGVVTPARRGKVVQLQKLVLGRWVKVAVAPLDAKGGYSFLLPTGTKGSATYRVYSPVDTTNLAGASAQLVLRVT